jgi:Ala-tRNA(Pro) deacylase
MTIASRVSELLRQHDIDHELIAHPASGSSSESADAAHIFADHVAKAVVVKDESGYAMVVIPASNWLELGHLQQEIGRDFELAEEAELDSIFADCQSGAVPPIGPAYGIETYLDQQLASLATVYFEGGDHVHLVRVSGEDFLTLLAGVRHGYFSHRH